MSSTVLCVILNWRTADMTRRATESALVAMEGIAGAITIVDNDSQDGSFEALSDAFAGHPRVRVIQSGRNGGYGAGNNVGISAGLPGSEAPEYVYILNSDAFPAPEAIRVLRDHLDAHPRVGFAGSHIHGEDGEAHTTAFRFPSALGELEGAAQTGPITRLLRRCVVAPPLPTTTGPVDWLAGASVMMRRSVLDKIGLFDETFFLYYEETDLCRRAARAGWPTVYVVESRVMHLGSVSTGMKNWRRVPDYWFRSRQHYFEKNHGRAYALLATVTHLAGIGIFSLRVLAGRRRPHWPPHFLRDLVRHSLKRA
jgi:N-acetylglucosaminyl-diphospho-decaprenol L-rhamnosyltransferase